MKQQTLTGFFFCTVLLVNVSTSAIEIYQELTNGFVVSE
jgi:hypothetical protein